MKERLIITAGQNTSASSRFRQVGIGVGDLARPAEVVIALRDIGRGSLSLPGSHKAPFCSSRVVRLGDPLQSCSAECHSGERLPTDIIVQQVQFPNLAVNGRWNGDLLLHAFVLVSRRNADRIVINRIVAAEVVAMDDTPFDSQQFEFGAGMDGAIQAYSRRHSPKNSRLAAHCYSRWANRQGLRHFHGSPPAFFRAAGTPIVTITPEAELAGAQDPNRFSAPRELMRKIPRRFFARPGVPTPEQEVISS